MQPIRHHHFPHRSQNRFRMKLKSANIIAFMRQGHNSACSILSGNCKTLRQIFPTYHPGMIPAYIKTFAQTGEHLFFGNHPHRCTNTMKNFRQILQSAPKHLPDGLSPRQTPGLIFQPHNASQLRVIFRLHLEFPAPETK